MPACRDFKWDLQSQKFGISAFAYPTPFVGSPGNRVCRIAFSVHAIELRHWDQSSSKGRLHSSLDGGGRRCLCRRTSGVVGDESEQAVLAQQIRRIAYGREWDAGSLGDVQERVPPIGEVQHPETGRDLDPGRLTARGAVEVSPSQLRFTERGLVAIPPIVFKHVQDGSADTEGSGKLERPDKVKVVG
jgi:hypothetical protein